MYLFILNNILKKHCEWANIGLRVLEVLLVTEFFEDFTSMYILPNQRPLRSSNATAIKSAEDRDQMTTTT